VNEHTHDEKDSRTKKNEEIFVSNRTAKRKSLTTGNGRKGTRQGQNVDGLNQNA
jgi:hypothetical protein